MAGHIQCPKHDVPVVQPGGSCWCCAQEECGPEAYASDKKARKAAHAKVAERGGHNYHVAPPEFEPDNEE